MNTFERLIKIFNDVFEDNISIETVTPEASLRDDIGIDSVGLLYMAMAIEEEFGVKFNNDDFIDINTVNDVIDCIEKKV